VLLLVGGLLSTVVFRGVYERLRPTEPGLALLGFVLAVAGAFGAMALGAKTSRISSNRPRRSTRHSAA
jgi:hypothetical protein